MFSWLSLISGVISAIGKALGLVHDANERAAGKTEQVAADLKESNDADKAALKASVDATDQSVSDSLRDGRF